MKTFKSLSAIIVLYACSIMALWAQAPFGQTSGQPWEAKYFYATNSSGLAPAENWYATDFDDSAWETITGPISNISSYIHHSTWLDYYSTYWVRRQFTLDNVSNINTIYLCTIHDDGCVIYLNGHLIYEYNDVRSNVNYEVTLTEEQKAYLNEGENLLAVRVTNNAGNGFMDFGLEVKTEEGGIIYRGTSAFGLSDRERTAYTIKEGTTHINSNLFNGCTNMTSISIPSSVVSVGNNAFAGCTSLPVEGYIRYADCFAVEVIDKNQSTYTLKEGTRFLNKGLFQNCHSLQSITIPNSVKEISEYAFKYCSNLTNITLPEGLRTIDNYAFDGCYALTNITLPEGLTTIGVSAFCNCNALTNITLPEGLTTIGNYAFSLCSGLTNITLPESLTYIGENAFANCSSLPVENFIRYADWYAFEVTERDLKGYTLKAGTRMMSDGLFNNIDELQSISLPEGLIEISEKAFCDCGALSSVKLPESLTSIGNEAFYKCTNLPSANFPEGLTSIGSQAFAYCDSIKTISIPSTLKTASDNVFYGVGKNLERIEVAAPNFPLNNLFFSSNNNKLKAIVCHSEKALTMNNASSVPSSAIVYVPEGCYNSYQNVFTNNIIVDGEVNKVNVTVSVPGTLGEEILNQVENLRDVNELTISGTINDADKECITKSLVNLMHLDVSNLKLENISGLGHKQLFSIKFPEGCKSISGFRGYYNLEHITLPNSLEAIEDYSFYNCEFLKELQMPQSLKTIGKYAFAACYNLSNFVCNDSLISIGQRAFENCHKLESVTLNDPLKTINSYAFYNCDQLKTINIPQGLTGLSSGIFMSCDSLKSIQLHENIKTIDAQAFESCSNLSSINLPEGLTQIRSNAFEGCRSLTNLQLPSTLMYCEGNAFLNTGLTSLTCSAFFPPIATGDLIGTNSCTLYVPEWTINNYKLANNWNLFSAIEPIADLYPENITVYSNASLAIPEAGLPTDYKPSMALIKNEVSNGAGRLSIRGEQSLPLSSFKMKHSNGVNTMTSLVNYGTITADQVVTELNLSANNWHFLTFPYDVKISDIATIGNWVISYYDGASRAQGQLGNNWKTMPYDSILHAGEGYIWQSVNGTFSVPAMDNDNRNLIFANDTRYIQLKEHTAAQAANSGWNLIGNPYPCFYDTRCMTFDAPITVRNGNSYTAYSTTDDSYILSPFEAFFVQCSAESNTIGFAPEGRQNSNAAIERTAHMGRTANHERHVFNVHLTGNAQTDRTRFVINEMAAMDYETSCDAAKFMSDDTTMPQIFCIEGGERLAINERPMASGEINLGVYLGTAGTYTLSIDSRNTNMDAVLVDKLTNVETTLTAGTTYTFTAAAGTHNNRFAIRMNENGTVNGIETTPTAALLINATEGGICVSHAPTSVMLYTLTGTLVGNKCGEDIRFNVPQGVYIVKVGNSTYKVSVTQ